MFLRPFGLYFSACFGSLFVSILCINTLMFSKIVPITPFPLRKLLSVRLCRLCVQTGNRLSRVQIGVLQGHAASTISAEKRFFSAKTTPTTVFSKLRHSPTKLHDVITEDRNLKKLHIMQGKINILLPT